MKSCTSGDGCHFLWLVLLEVSSFFFLLLPTVYVCLCVFCCFFFLFSFTFYLLFLSTSFGSPYSVSSSSVLVCLAFYGFRGCWRKGVEREGGDRESSLDGFVDLSFDRFLFILCRLHCWSWAAGNETHAWTDEAIANHVSSLILSDDDTIVVLI